MPSKNSSFASSSDTKQKPCEFSLAEILKATNNFDQSLLLRRGRKTEIYKGTCKDHDGKLRSITIKVFTMDSLTKESKHELSTWGSYNQETLKTCFQQEFKEWSQYHHKHVVSLIGYCCESGWNILVYQDMANGSLSQNLCKKITPTGFHLSGKQCFQICIDAARGLEYIRNKVRTTSNPGLDLPFSGRIPSEYGSGSDDLPSLLSTTTILLDEDGVAKISVLYSDPELHSTDAMPQNSDVYSFGVLLIKVLSRKVSFENEDSRDRNLVKLFKECIQNETIEHRIIHPEMKAQFSPECLTALVDIADECLIDASIYRPKLSQVIEKLKLLLPSYTRKPCYSYSLQEIKGATNNFDEENFLGEGGEGKVYKGVIMKDTIVAVKCLKDELTSEFEKEVKMLSDLHHPNLLSLIGYCHEPNKNILIYEFMINGNLAQSLKSTTEHLSWMQILNISIGVARGLNYLQEGTHTSQKGIIHRDIKPANILLDENFNAKISDFGTCKIGPQVQEHSKIYTEKLTGTPGYFAPEYCQYGEITRRIDVYSLGLVLIEMISGKDVWTCKKLSKDNNYSQWAKKNIDPHLKTSIAPLCLEAYVGTLEKCLSYDQDKRPEINDVVLMLEYALKAQEASKMPKIEGVIQLPGAEDKPAILYCSLTSGSFIKTRLLLQRYAMFIDERDLANELCVKELKQALGNTVDIHKPHLFLDGKHIGADEINRRCVTGELADCLGLKKLTCSKCQDARACAVCRRKEMYVHCYSCGALTLVLYEIERKQSSCNECHANSLHQQCITFYFRKKNSVAQNTRGLTKNMNIVKKHRKWMEQETYCLSTDHYLPLLVMDN